MESKKKFGMNNINLVAIDKTIIYLKAILSHKSDEIQLSLGLADSFECLFLL